MRDVLVVLFVVILVVAVVAAEVLAAVLPMIIIITMVPSQERAELAQLMAAADSSHRLRVWSALRVAVLARRRARAERWTIPTGSGTHVDHR